MVGLGVVFRFETSRQEAGGRRGGDLAIEFDLLPSAVPAAGQALRQAGLEDERLRRAGGLALIGRGVKRTMRESTVDRGCSASTALTRPWPRAPLRRSASVRDSGVIDSGGACVVILSPSLRAPF